jgi:midasin
MDDDVNSDNDSNGHDESRKKWSKRNAETNNLSCRLFEKLCLILEPLVASKLCGDYRTGERINM